MRLKLILITIAISIMVYGRSIGTAKNYANGSHKVDRLFLLSSSIKSRNKRAAQAITDGEMNINFFQDLKKLDSPPHYTHNHNQQHHRPCHHRRNNGRRSNCSRNRRIQVYARVN